MTEEYIVLQMSYEEYIEYCLIYPEYTNEKFVKKKSIFDFGFGLSNITTNYFLAYKSINQKIINNPSGVFDFAIANGSCTMIKSLINTNPKLSKEWGLVLAAKSSRMDSFEFLIKCGANINLVIEDLVEAIVDLDNIIFFIIAIYHGVPLWDLKRESQKREKSCFDSVLLLLDKDLDGRALKESIHKILIKIYTKDQYLRIEDEEKDYFPRGRFKPSKEEFMIACAIGIYPIVEYYVDNLLYYSAFNEGLTEATTMGRYLVVDKLLQAPIQVRRIDPLMAVSKQRYDIFRLLSIHVKLFNIGS